MSGEPATIENVRGWIAQFPTRAEALEAFLGEYIRARATSFQEMRKAGREPKIVGLDAIAMELDKARPKRRKT